MDAKLKALKVHDLKAVLARAQVSAPARATKSDLVARILAGLDALLERDGFAHVADAVGSGRDEWLALDG